MIIRQASIETKTRQDLIETGMPGSSSLMAGRREAETTIQLDLIWPGPPSTETLAELGGAIADGDWERMGAILARSS